MSRLAALTAVAITKMSPDEGGCLNNVAQSAGRLMEGQHT